MSYRWVLIVHLQDSMGDVLQNVDHLLFTKTFTTEFDKKVKECTLCAEFANDAYLTLAWRCLSYLSFMHCDDILMATNFSPHLHLISD